MHCATLALTRLRMYDIGMTNSQEAARRVEELERQKRIKAVVTHSPAPWFVTELKASYPGPAEREGYEIQWQGDSVRILLT